MASRIFDHIDLRVSNLAQARKFYDVLMPAVGLTERRGDDASPGYVVPGEFTNSPFVWLSEEPGHRGGANRIAFWADTEEEVNRLAEVIREAGALMVEGPEYCHDYTPGYYAVFFEDGECAEPRQATLPAAGCTGSGRSSLRGRRWLPR